MGGKERMDSIRTIIWTGILSSQFNIVDYKVFQKKPNLFVYEFIEDSINTRRICYDGDQLCIKESNNNYSPRSPSIEVNRKWGQQSINAFIDHEYLSMYTPQLIELLPLKGQLHFKIVKKVDLLISYIFYIDKKTYLLSKEEISKGGKIISEICYYDYKILGEIPFPLKKTERSFTNSGTNTLEIHFTSIEINTPIDFGTFSCKSK